MAIHEATPLLTYEDYLLFPEDGQRHEILGGEHVVTPAPVPWHQRLSFRLSYYIEAALQRNGAGEAFAAPTDVRLSKNDIVQPDLFFISKERIALVGERYIQGAPDLVIEILSKSTHLLDEDLKLKAYERWGVDEYWIFDPNRKTVRVWERGVEGLRTKAQLSAAAGEVLTTPRLPGLEIPLAELFRR